MLAEQRLDKRIYLFGVSEPVSAGILKVLKGTSPPAIPRGLMSEARQSSTMGSDWDAVEVLTGTDWNALEQKSAGEHAVELYGFVKKYDIQLLSRRARQWIMAAIDPGGAAGRGKCEAVFN
ncbi:hypothetical protein DPSP01_007830 [Paraphaeosphaeria sporulosa]|uniref:Uncharacterized protein n=1 Tax=Paraphaeosphaeria sporulosa TaxID=1460663 RepID=A0A177CIU3_9PLEO|nr:uncharacterized protein CC84DRAFT_1216396 [Paraphaeosphaeria sporulosa]OAG07435.1 hypothetical protein CC84DRAFT_1216396 [Paraphaeosphaeria sporulosa]